MTRSLKVGATICAFAPQFSSSNAEAQPGARTYADVLQDQLLQQEKAEVLKKAADKMKEQEQAKAAGAAPQKRRRWDEGTETPNAPASDMKAASNVSATASESWDQNDTGVSSSQWSDSSASSQGHVKRSRWDQTPSITPSLAGAETPSKKKSRWDETPTGTAPSVLAATPVGNMAMGMVTPSVNFSMMTPEQVQKFRLRQEMDERNRPMTDEELNALFPPDGYEILDPPSTYIPIRANRLAATPTPMGLNTGYQIPVEDRDVSKYGIAVPSDPDLPEMKPEDEQYFAKLLVDVDEGTLDTESLKERRIMKLLLKLKNGTPQMRKSALRTLTDKAREFGASALFSQILPLLMAPTLEDQERHLLVKV